jgi:glycosyltransferase involved in cell wall biosynthesis
MTKILTVMSCHNAEATVARAINSVIRQGGELGVLDDCSTDRTLNIAVECNCAVDNPWQQFRIGANPKSSNWQEALAEEVDRWDHVGCTHVLGLGADDFLLPGCIEAMERQDADIIWADYYFVNWRGQAVNVSTSGMVAPGYVDAATVSEMFAEQDNPFQAAWRPSGVACAVRRDLWLDMMLNKRAYELGPHSDTIALNLLACQRGATFIPQKLAAFTLRHKGGKKSYSQASNAGGERPMYYERAVEYVRRNGDGVSREAKDGILRKWFPDLHKP